MLDSTDQIVDLLRQVAAGDREAFRCLYEATSSKLYGVLLRILKRRDLADEILQETYVRIWRHAGAFDPERASPITWMVSIARNRALDEVRKAAPLQLDDHPAAMEIVDPQILALDRMLAGEQIDRLQTCLDALEPERRELVKLAYLEGLSREELGQRVGHPAGTIKTWLHRSLKQLKSCLTS